MGNVLENAQRLVLLFERMRRAAPPQPVFTQLGQLNLSFSHMHALRLLGMHGQMPMKELAEQLKITPPSVTALTRRLVQSNFVQRTAHPDDSRVVVLSLTEQGRSFYCQWGQGHVQQMARLLQGLSEQEQEQFLDLLERAVSAMQAQADLQDAASARLSEEPPTADQADATPTPTVEK